MMETELCSEEMIDAENYLIRISEKEAFKDEYSSLVKKKDIASNSKLISLYHRLDGDGVMRSDGRLVSTL